jgi:methylenetetrahydrofolate dehydrogenase (NADP+)/methenyltetrahydrofolate cyclohydrolase/formyltetrahydrofolate synthetase/formate--tetrahydrofolate ligase
VVPVEELHLHLTGDLHAVAAAHNLLAAAVDARLLHEERLSDQGLEKLGLRRLDMDPYSIAWKRVLDINDRALRRIVLGLGSEEDGRPRESGFEITAASEVMAILALATDLKDLRQRLGRIVVGLSRAGRPVTAEDLGAAGAMAALLKEALRPNLMQTVEGSPVLVHAGPFANIAHGNSSIVADRIGLKLVSGGYLVTEAGFGAECGLEKFADIKCRLSGLRPDAAVLVATVRALKVHGGGPKVVPGRKLPLAYAGENLELVEKGLVNLEANIHIVGRFGLPVVVAINRFPTDTPAEIELIRQAALEAGAEDACASQVWEQGGAGGVELAQAVVRACEKGADFRFLYPLEAPLEQKIETIATQVYGANGVEWGGGVREQLARFAGLGYGSLPVVMAKTHLSLSHDPAQKGVPKGYLLPVREVRLAAGAGFLYALCGEIQTMPGLPSRPAFMEVDLDEEGQVIGLG